MIKYIQKLAFKICSALILISNVFIAIEVSGAAPTPSSISSISPVSQLIGSTITITGSFSAPVGIYFGTIKQSNFISSSATSIICKVPSGAAFDYISVLDAKGYSFSAEKFVPRFAGNYTLTATNFINPNPSSLSFQNSLNNVRNSLTKDLNNDGIPEIINLVNDESNGEGVSIFQFTSTSNYPNNYITLPFLGIQGTGVAIELADITNDGLPEIVLVSSSNKTLLTIFENTSSISGISFNVPTVINVNQISYPSAVKSGDFDNDNKIDLAIADASSYTVAILKNDLIQGDISGSFTSVFSIATGDNNTDIEVADFDNDGKVDIVCGSATNGDAINFLLNTSSNSISFGVPSIFSWIDNSNPINDIKVVDIDGDNKIDVAVSQSDRITFLRNISTIGDIEMDLASLVYESWSPSSFAFGDLDGDGKPDLVLSQTNKDSLIIAKNLAGVGTFSGIMFSSNNSFGISPYYPINYINLADFNGDGKPDLTASFNTINQLFFTNGIGSEPIITSISSNSGKPGDNFTVFGQNLTNVIGVSIQGSYNSYFYFTPADIISDNEIVVHVSVNQPYGTITGKLLLGTSGSPQGYSDFDFSLIAAPNAVVTSIISNNISGTSNFAIGDFLTIIGSNLSDVESVSFSSYTNSGINLSIISKTDSQLVLSSDYCSYNNVLYQSETLTFYKALSNSVSSQSINLIPQILPSVSGISSLTAFPQDIITLTGVHLEQVSALYFPNNPYGQATISYQDPNTLVTKVTNFDSDTSGKGLGYLNLYYCSENQVNPSPTITINVPPLPTVTGFNPTESYAGAYVTVFGQNLQYATHFDVSQSGQGTVDANIIEVGNSQTVIQLSNQFSTKSTGDIAGTISAYYVDSYPSQYFTSSTGIYTVHPYPLATITSFSPKSVLPFEPVSIFGFNFNYIDYVELPQYFTAYDYEVVSPNLIIAKADLSSNSPLQDIIHLSYSNQAGNDVYSTGSITVDTFSGIIDTILVDKPIYSNGKLIAHLHYTGILPPTDYANYNLTIRNDTLGEFGVEISFLDLSNSATVSSIPGIIDFELDSSSLNKVYPFKSSPNYYVVGEVSYGQGEGQVYYKSSTSALFTINAAPEFDQKNPFNRYFGAAGDSVNLYGLNFYNSSITGVFYNLTIPATYFVHSNANTSNGQFINEFISTAVPQGNTKGKIRITYANGEILSPFDFNTPPPCSVAFNFINTTLSGSGQYNSGDILSLNVSRDSNNSENGVIVGFVELSGDFGIFDSLTTSQIGYDDGLYSLNKNIPITIPSNISSGTFYSMQLLYTDGVGSCIQPIRDNITINGSNLPKYIPVQSMSIYANEDSSTLFPKAYTVMPINAKFVPDSATNQKYKLQLFQSANLIAETDTLNHFFNFISAANGIATIIGTSLDNPKAISMVVVTLIGADAVTTQTIQTRQVTVSGTTQTVYSACDRTIELFIDTTVNKYIGYQWYLARSNGDTAKIVGANQPEFRPVIEGNYFVKTFDSAANYKYASFPITVNSPSKPTVARPGINDIETDTILIASDADKYQWFVNGKLIKNATNKQLRVYYNGVYYVAITNTKTNCKAVSDTVSFTRPDFVDIGRADLFGTDSTIENYGLSSKKNLKLYPNPATDQFTVQYESGSTRTLVVKVFNNMGIEIIDKSIIFMKNPIRLLSIQTSGLPFGLYYVQIIDGEDVTNKKILIK